MPDISVPHSVVFEAGSICGELYHHMAYKGGLDNIRAAREGIFGERLYGACLVLAAEVATLIDTYIDWGNCIGVFVYDYIEVGAGNVPGNPYPSLPDYLLDLMSVDHWQGLTDDYELPQDLSAWVLEYLQQWVDSKHFPMKVKSDDTH